MRKPYQVRDAEPKPRRYGPPVFSGCVHCGKPATKEALFRDDGITIVEKYCENCMQAENFSAIMTIYSRN